MKKEKNGIHKVGLLGEEHLQSPFACRNMLGERDLNFQLFWTRECVDQMAQNKAQERNRNHKAL